VPAFQLARHGQQRVRNPAFQDPAGGPVRLSDRQPTGFQRAPTIFGTRIL